MSNIIDGHDIGMGYEKATVRGPGVQMLLCGRWTASVDPNYEIKAGVLHRRPLPIISQHPGAIPLEPGEELVEGECYLMRDGRLTGPLPCDGHEAFPFGIDGTPDTWRRDGSCWDNDISTRDIIARLPKVEQKEPEKAKEEKVGSGIHETQLLPIEIYNPSNGSSAFIELSEASRIAQLPEVQAEVERQRKEKEIKVGDWFIDRKTYFRCTRIPDNDIPHVVSECGYHKTKNCTKITDPDFIEMLERGTQP